MRDIQQVRVWRSAHELALHVYQMTRRLPDSERYGLQAQMRRAAVSVPSNIAEGCGRRTHSELHNFLGIASGSLTELDSLTNFKIDKAVGPDSLANFKIGEAVWRKKKTVSPISNW